LQFGYKLSDKTIENSGISKARFYISGENLFTITSFSGLDPDIGGRSTLSGVDWGHYPLPRIINIGINLAF